MEQLARRYWPQIQGNATAVWVYPLGLGDLFRRARTSSTSRSTCRPANSPGGPMIRSRLVVTKQTPLARNGMVAAEHWRGAEVGAGILWPRRQRRRRRRGHGLRHDRRRAVHVHHRRLGHDARAPGPQGRDGGARLQRRRAAGGPRDAVHAGRAASRTASSRGRAPRTTAQRVRAPLGGRARLGGRTLPGPARYGTMELRDVHGAGHRAGPRRLRAGLVPGPDHGQVRRGAGAFPETARTYLRDGRSIYRPAGMRAGRSLDLPRPRPQPAS